MLQNETAKQSPESITVRGLLASMLSGTWPKIVIIVFVIELAGLFLGSAIPISQSTVSQVSSQNNALAQTSQSLDLVSRAFFLFSNNFTIALYEFVPLLGWFFFGFSMYNTAIAIEVIGAGANLPGPLVALSLLFQPHSWLELPAYSVAITQSFYLVSTAARRSKFKFEVARTGLVIVVVGFELLVAALFESSEISLLSYGLAVDFLVPWVFFAILLALLLIGRRKILKGNTPEYFRSPPIYTPQNIGSQMPTLTQKNYPSFCTNCGARVQSPDVARFCDQCGQRLTPQNS